MARQRAARGVTQHEVRRLSHCETVRVRRGEARRDKRAACAADNVVHAEILRKADAGALARRGRALRDDDAVAARGCLDREHAAGKRRGRGRAEAGVDRGHGVVHRCAGAERRKIYRGRRDQLAIRLGYREHRRTGEAQPIRTRKRRRASGQLVRCGNGGSGVGNGVQRLRETGEQHAKLFGEDGQRAIPQIDQSAKLAADRRGIDLVAGRYTSAAAGIGKTQRDDRIVRLGHPAARKRQRQLPQPVIEQGRARRGIDRDPAIALFADVDLHQSAQFLDRRHALILHTGRTVARTVEPGDRAVEIVDSHQQRIDPIDAVADFGLHVGAQRGHVGTELVHRGNRVLHVRCERRDRLWRGLHARHRHR